MHRLEALNKPCVGSVYSELIAKTACDEIPNSLPRNRRDSGRKMLMDLRMPGFLRRQLPRGSHQAATQTQELSYSWPSAAQAQS